jgi:putative polyketide hydroxylase
MQPPSPSHETNCVLVVGGSLNGLTTALLLAHHRVPCVLVERHPGTSIQYKFSGISPRSMEVFRSVGIEDEIRSNKTGDQQSGGIARGRTLSDPAITWMRESAWSDVGELGPCQPATCDQHQLEPILRRHAERLGADVRFDTELLSLEQNDEGVIARVRRRRDNHVYEIAARYVIAADGASGALREWLGIPRDGVGGLQHFMNVIFETDLKPFIDGKRFTSCFVSELNATITPRDDGRWLLAIPYDPDRGEKPGDFDADRCRELVRHGAGNPRAKAELVDARSWEVSAFIAQRFRERHVFLLGDAAHVMPPTGAFGGNTGIHDAHNLVWKLAAVLQGHADPALLDTYDSERRPVAQRTLAQALARLQAWFKNQQKPLPPPEPIIDDYDVVFGQRYDAGALVRTEVTPDRPFENAAGLSGLPGTRAPHLPLDNANGASSLLDLFDREFVLLSGRAGASWHDGGERLRAAHLPVKCLRVGEGSDVAVKGDADRWRATFGVSNAGAVLVRPDGFVAWLSRDRHENPEALLADVFRQLKLNLGSREVAQ